MTKYQIIVLILALLLSSASLAGRLTAAVNSNQIGIADTLNLIVGYDQKVATSELNYSALNKDFNVLSVNPSSSSSYQMVNGRTSQKYNIQWRFTLTPKRGGQLIIPSMSINGDNSQAISIKVLQTAVSTGPKAIDLIASVDSSDIYINQQVIVAFDFKFMGDVKPSGFNFDVGGSKISPTLLGQFNGSIVENGIRYNTARVSYAFFPEKTGTYSIKPQLFVGIQNRQRVAARSKAINFKVKAAHLESKPRAFWLPANRVTWRDKWANSLDDIRVGEPITRTLILEVDGQQSNRLPSFEFESDDEFKFYTNQPKFDQKVEPTGIKSTRIDTVAIIAQREGELTLPAITLPWWDNKASQWQEITLPAKTIEVNPARQTFEQIPNIVINDNNFNNNTATDTNTVPPVWFYSTLILATTCLIMLLVIIVLWQRQRPTDNSKRLAKQIALATERQLWQQIQIATDKRDAQLLYNALVKWAKSRWGNSIRSTDDIIDHCDNPIITQQLDLINKNLYRSVANDNDDDDNIDAIDYSALLAALAELRKTAGGTNRSPNQIPSLYPSA